MPLLIWANQKEQLEKSLKSRVFDFCGKLQMDDTTPGLHIEPLHNVADERVRTGRVDQAYRAVVFKLPTANDVAYVYAGTWHHDEAIARAKTMVLDRNPLTGVPEFKTVVVDGTPAEGPAPSPLIDGDSPTSLLGGWGYTLENLVDDLGIDVTTARAAMRATGEDGLLEAADRAVEWQGLALLDLAKGVSIADLRIKYALDQPVVDDPARTVEENLIEAFNHPAARAAFTFVDDNEELRRVIEGGDFGAWRVFLHPEQRAYATRDWNGAFRLSGGAGTGKTVVLLHRARHLALADPQTRVVLTTYTRNLAEMLRASIQQLDPGLKLADSLGEPGVFVAGVDQLASQVLKAAGPDIGPAAEAVLGEPVTHVNNRTDNDAWASAISTAGADLPEELKSPAFFAAEYAMVVVPARIRTRAEYFAVARPGRGVALNRGRRSQVWSVIENYRRWANLAGTVDYDEAAAIAAARFELVGEAGRPADHVLVDEGQDLTPARWQLLRELAPEGVNDLFIAEDSHQRIYGQPVVLGRYGIRIVGRSRRLTLNYRTTAQNLAFAVHMLQGGSYFDMEGDAEDTSTYHSARLGPVPDVRECSGLSDELDTVANVLKQWLAVEDATPESLAVLVRDQAQQTRVVTGLSERGVTVRPVTRESSIKPGLPSVLTMHRAKGTEFSNVVLFGVSEGSIPAALKAEKYSNESWDDAMLRERSLLYVAATRARDELVVTWSGERSELLGAEQLV